MALREPFPGFPPPLTTRPEGLLSMLGLQTNGSYPQHLAYDNLLPSLDLLNWYLESRAEIQSAAGVAQAGAIGGFNQLFQVPPQEVWVLLAYSIAPVAIGTNTAIQPVRCRSNDDLSRLALGDPVTYTPGNQFALAYSREHVRHLVFRPTVQIGYVTTTGGIIGNSFNATLRFVRCNI